MKYPTRKYADSVNEISEINNAETKKSMIAGLASLIKREKNPKKVLKQIEQVFSARESQNNRLYRIEAASEREAEKIKSAISDGVITESAVNPSLIGGAKIYKNDELVNGSIAGRLETLREALIK
ncbi:MAG: hypothetical protein A3G59_00235 [Candidatus Taylorbacteria bacterium RIFCSPLOWO2_12_FULL_47_20]|uniref:Uncharacterized protein n=1 Tax=Candidatus Taylorbacteria bacterium RIFCSPLOWO2_12_FULL_47_20 TaxID=1802335 RepID=A0A1G2P8K2_9BACT|nr:MAG: hypothetical protein A3G59_00235 [Candidatus Taylorbacteria bacterium RIFCSPLOWO2_12_FULL_47_20]